MVLITAYRDRVIVEGVEVMRPSAVSPGQWLLFWDVFCSFTERDLEALLRLREKREAVWCR